MTASIPTRTTASDHERSGEGDSSGRRWARLGLTLVGLILVGSRSVAAAQIPPLPDPPRIEDTVRQTVDGIEDTADDVAGKLREQADSAQDMVEESLHAPRHEGQTQTRTAGAHRTRGEPQRPTEGAEELAQDRGRGKKNEDGDINRLVDAGDEIEGTQVEGNQNDPGRDPGRTLPLTGFDPRSLAAGGLAMIAAGLVLLMVAVRLQPAMGP